MYTGYFKKENVIRIFMIVLLLAAFATSVRVEAKAKRQKAEISKEQVTAYPGMAPVRLKVKNLKPGKVVVWKSSKPEVAAVAADGTVSFGKKGNAIITAKAGKKKYKCVVSVTSKKAYKAVAKAQQFYKARNMSYSQGNRMGKRSADCSSFCGRCYLEVGMTLGGSASWCNTAAGMAQWTTQHHKVLSNRAVCVSSMDLLPGDLVFYKKGYNGRYKNIYHVEIFVEYGWRNGKLVGYTMSSITGNYPSILKRDYASRQSRIAQISRPAE